MGHASNLHRASRVAGSGPMTTTRMTREPELVRIGSDIDLRPIQDLTSCAIDSACRGPHAEAGEGTLTARLGPNRLYESPRPNSKHHQGHHVSPSMVANQKFAMATPKKDRESATRCQTVGVAQHQSDRVIFLISPPGGDYTR